MTMATDDRGLSTPLRRNDAWVAALPLAVGIAAFFLVVGPRVLDPTNLAWLGDGDPAMYYLGWLFFRNSPWSFPAGLNPSYGLEIGNAIPYSDSNPLLALAFKPLSPLLPEPFQYFGIWLLACFILQAWFGWKVLGLISERVAIRLLGVGFLVFSPPMIWRLHERIGHLNLVAHFLILAALYLTLRPGSERRLLAWVSILGVAALVHAYLFGMVALLWIADLAARALAKEIAVQRVAIEGVSLGILIGAISWQAGYFSVVTGIAASGFGAVRMNLLSIFDAGKTDYGLWSYVMWDLPGDAEHHEGFNFLGLGMIVLLPLAGYALAGRGNELRRMAGRKWVLLVLLAGLTLFALSNKVGVGRYDFVYAVGEPLLRAANVFRSSARMFWPVFYAIVFAVLLFIVRGYGQRTSTWLLGLALAVQVADTSAGWLGVRNALMAEQASAWTAPLVDPFWEEAARRYTKVRRIPVGNSVPQWYVAAAYAGRHGLATDVVYLARIDSFALDKAWRKASEAIQTGKYDHDALYFLDDATLDLAIVRIDTSTDLVARIDGFNVIAPGWKKCTACRRVPSEIKATAWPIQGQPIAP